MHKEQFIFTAAWPRSSARATQKQSDRLRCSAAKYTAQVQAKTGINLILTHANGFAKELYEPFIETLLSNEDVEAVYIHDVVTHAQSARLNDGKLGDEFPWYDSARDILKMIWELRESGRMSYGPLIGIGHSMGGCQMLYCATLQQRLFEAVIAIEPILSGTFASQGEAAIGGTTLALLSGRRRNLWSSRDEARRLFSKSAFYKSWDPAVFELWMQYGLVSVGPDTEEVTLSTPPAAEVHSFMQWLPHRNADPTDVDCSAYVYEMLPSYKHPIHFIFGAETTSLTPKHRAEFVARTKVATRVDVKDAGHLVAMEVPQELGNVCNGYISNAFKSWLGREEEEKRNPFKQDLAALMVTIKGIRDEALEEIASRSKL